MPLSHPFAWTPSLSQSNRQLTPRFGIIAGVNRASLPGDYTPHGNRTGFAGGLMSVLPLSELLARAAVTRDKIRRGEAEPTDSGKTSELGQRRA